MVLAGVLSRSVMSGIVLCLLVPRSPAQNPDAQPALIFPGLLEREARDAGNPLAPYLAMVRLEEQYLASPIFAKIYPEVRLNYEQFLGVPNAGLRAMDILARRANTVGATVPDLDGYEPKSAVDAVLAAAEGTRVVIWGEEHHLPQTRSLYIALIRGLHERGYRYLAAESFSPAVAREGFETPDYHSGYYTMDPVFAEAVRVAVELGYELVPYDTSERGPPGKSGFRDRRQAENIQTRTFAKDPEARVLILAGRLHASERPAPDGWTPMATVLSRLTGIDPFTIYAPTMSERLTSELEDPIFRAVDARGWLREPTIVFDAEGSPLGSDCDAYVFWPRQKLQAGRPDWMVTTLGRIPVSLDDARAKGEGVRLVQAFFEGDPDDTVPLDQVLLRPGSSVPALMLRPGRFRLRVLGADGVVGESWTIEVADEAADGK